MAERFSASYATRHLNCHASANLKAAIPGYEDPPDDGRIKASVLGTEMHRFMELAQAYSPAEVLALARAMEYVAELRKRRRFKMRLEAQGQGWWLVGKPNTTADVLLYVSDEIHVIDYKFGRVPVEVDGNDQGKYYSLAFLPMAPRAKGVHFHIVQPLVDNIESTFFTRAELEQFKADTIAAQDAILNGSVKFSPGDHCQFCPANPHSRGAKGSVYCPAMLQVLYPPPPLDEDAILDLA